MPIVSVEAISLQFFCRILSTPLEVVSKVLFVKWTDDGKSLSPICSRHLADDEYSVMMSKNSARNQKKRGKWMIISDARIWFLHFHRILLSYVHILTTHEPEKSIMKLEHHNGRRFYIYWHLGIHSVHCSRLDTGFGSGSTQRDSEHSGCLRPSIFSSNNRTNNS